jgi:hypothetical protein
MRSLDRTVHAGQRASGGALLAMILAALASAPGVGGGAALAQTADKETGTRRWRVQGVAADDTLNLRRSPDPSSPLVGTIPPDATAVITTGRVRQVHRSVWREVRYGRVRGWANGRYLAATAAPAPVAGLHRRRPLRPAPTAVALEDDLVCDLPEPLWKVAIDRAGQARCTETCDAPEGLRATSLRRAAGEQRAWTMDIRQASGAPFMTVSVRRTDHCTQPLLGHHYAYEISARRPLEITYQGCCNVLPDAAVPPLGPPASPPPPPPPPPSAGPAHPAASSDN